MYGGKTTPNSWSSDFLNRTSLSHQEHVNTRTLPCFFSIHPDSLKKVLVILFALAAFSREAVARQQPGASYPDSLMAAVTAATTDSAKARLLFRLSDYWADRDSARAVDIAQQSFRYTKNNSFLRGVAHFYRAGAYYSYDIIKSQQDYMQADEILQRFSTPESFQYRSRAWHNYGALDQLMDNSKGFVEALLSRAIPLAQAAGDQERVAWNYMDLGAEFMNYKNYERAGDYYEKAIKILNGLHERSLVLAECLMSKSKSFVLQNKPDSATSSLKEAFKILSSNSDSSYLPVYYCIEGMYYSRLKQWPQAIASLNKGDTLAAQLNRPYDAATIAYEKYEVYKQQGQLEKAKPFLEKAYKLQARHAISTNIRLLLFELAKTEKALGHPAIAFDQMLQYAQLSDSVFTAQTAVTIAGLETKYRVAEKEKQLLRLQNRNQVQRLLLYFGACLLGLLGGFIYYAYRQRKKRDKQRLNTMQQELEMQITKAQLQGEEKERQRLARDLHDGLGGMLAGIKLNLSVASHDKERGQSVELGNVIAQVDNSVHELRRIARNMVPEILVRAGFSNAIRDLCKTMDTQTMRVECELLNLQENIRMQEKIEIYRIVQELLANAARHSGATEVFLQCSKVHERFYITIEDNGKGLPEPDNSRHGNGMGLENIRSRLAYMHGKIELQSSPGKGTIINIEINVTEER